MADGLFMPDGTFQPFSGAELSTELATRQNAGVFAGELGGWLNALPDPDPVLRKRGDDAAILRELSAAMLENPLSERWIAAMLSSLPALPPSSLSIPEKWSASLKQVQTDKERRFAEIQARRQTAIEGSLTDL